MIKHLKNIAEFNAVRGLLDKGFNPDLENGFLLSEELETLDFYPLANKLKMDIENHDDLARLMVLEYGTVMSDIDSKVNYCDKVVDHYFFGIGGMLKMGLNFKDIEDMFTAVEEANTAKGRQRVNGKIVKDSSFEAIDPKHIIRKIIEEKEMR